MLRLAPWLVLFACCAPAHAQIWRCEGADGVVKYTNTRPEPSTARHCSQVAPNLITTIPAPALPRGAAPAPAAAARSPAAYPRVDPAVQKARDGDRRRILEDELRREEGRLAELRKESTEFERAGRRPAERAQAIGDGITRAQANVDSLRREIAALKD